MQLIRSVSTIVLEGLRCLQSAEVREKSTDLKFKGRGDPQKCPYAANPEPQAQNLELQAPNFESQSQKLAPHESRRDQPTARSVARNPARSAVRQRETARSAVRYGVGPRAYGAKRRPYNGAKRGWLPQADAAVTA